jgi:predicted metal-dependent phosphoesterase TrpH
VPQIMSAAAKAGVDVVLLTDHDTLAARDHGQEGWHGDVLLLVGEEVTPDENHYLAFGVDSVIRKSGRSPADVCEAVEAQGGFGFAAHPFSEGSELFKRRGIPFNPLDCVKGVELWSFVNDTGQSIERWRDVVKFLATPNRYVDHPPARNMRAWDELCRKRPVAAIGGLDAHQVGVRVGRWVPLRLMSYKRSFRHIRTHVLIDGEPSRESVFSALREGRCYIAMDSLAPARGFMFENDGGTLRVRLPRDARMRLLRDGEEVTASSGRTLEYLPKGPGGYRVEAYLHAYGRERTWILSNPLYV